MCAPRGPVNSLIGWMLIVFRQGFVVLVDGFGSDFGFHLQPTLSLSSPINRADTLSLDKMKKIG